MIQPRITFIRHAHAVAGKIDKTRSLSTQGKLQAHHLALHLRSNSTFDLVITSSATRTKETAQIIMDTIGFSAQNIEIEALYEPSSLRDIEIVNRLLEDLGPASMNTYNQHDTQGAWNRYASEAFNALSAKISHEAHKKILVVAHGNIINALGIKMTKNSTMLNEIYFNYCNGFEICEDKLILLKLAK